MDCQSILYFLIFAVGHYYGFWRCGGGDGSDLFWAISVAERWLYGA